MNAQPRDLPAPLSYGRHLSTWRRARGLTQMALALHAEVSCRHISFLEQGRSAPSVSMVRRLARALDLDEAAEAEMLLAAGHAPGRFRLPLSALAEGELMRRSAASIALASALALASPGHAQGPHAVDLAALSARTTPSEGHRVLDALIGLWDVQKETYIVSGTPDRPLKSEGMRAQREWIADGRFLRDTMGGTMGGRRYFRTGLLGYDNVARRYDWTTVDNVTATMMIYQGQPGGRPGSPIVVEGSFFDLGISGEHNVGKRVQMRTVITILSPDRHVFELYFTPPDGRELLADRAVYTRAR